MQHGPGPLHQERSRQKAVSLPGGLGQHIEQAAPDPVLGIRPDPDPLGDLVRRREADPPDILRQPVGVGLHDLIEPGPVGLPDLRRIGAPDPELLQKDHGVAEVLFFLHLGPDLPGDPHADALDTGQLLGFLLHDPEGVVPEHFDDPGGQSGPDPLDAAGRQIAVHGLRVFRGQGPVGLNLELVPVNGMGRILSSHGTALPLADGDRIADTGQDITDIGLLRLTARLRLGGPGQGHFEDGIAVFFVPIDDMRHKAFQFGHRSLLKEAEKRGRRAGSPGESLGT